MRQTFAFFVSLALAVGAAQADPKKYKIKKVEEAVPNKLKAGIQKLFGNDAVQFKTADGELIATFWFRKSIPVRAGKDEIKKGVTYKALNDTEILGAVNFAQSWRDYRGQKISKGIYTLRFGMQPQDGDHMGTSMHPEFCVLLSAKFDPKAGHLPPQEMAERSAASIRRSHPAVFLLFPSKKAKGKELQLIAPADEHVALTIERNVTAGGEATDGKIGLVLAVVGRANE
ncbi:MAG: hypothetical protein ACFCD0_09610 [Gemmataceae bacterium]